MQPSERDTNYPMAVEEMAKLAAYLSESVYRETNDPDEADRWRFYKVERWNSAEQHVVELLYANNDLSKAKAMFAALEAPLAVRRYFFRCDSRKSSNSFCIMVVISFETMLSDHPS
jgi:hypothetical protein